MCDAAPFIYWPVPVTLMVCTPGFAESVTVIALARVPTALGVNVTVKVQPDLAANVVVHGVAPPGTIAKSPLPEITGLNDVARLLVIVTV